MYGFPSSEAFKDQFGEKLDFCPAPDLRALADELIERHAVTFGHLEQLRVEKMEPAQVEAALFHEMCHAGRSTEDDETPELWPHDVEMFAAEVREYGLWRQDLQCLKQLGLFETRVVDGATGEVFDQAALAAHAALDGALRSSRGEPHLHRRQDDKYPAAVCSDAGCTLEPRYPVSPVGARA